MPKRELKKEIEALLAAGQIDNAAITITAVYRDELADTVKYFYENWPKNPEHGRFSEELLQVFLVSKIFPDKDVAKEFIRTVVANYKSQTIDKIQLPELIKACYTMLIHYKWLGAFLELYGRTQIDPPQDFIYQAIILARLEKQEEIRQKICETFGVMA